MANILVDFPVYYNCEALLKGKRKKNNYTVTNKVTIEIPVVDISEVECVAELNHKIYNTAPMRCNKFFNIDGKMVSNVCQDSENFKLDYLNNISTLTNNIMNEKEEFQINTNMDYVYKTLLENIKSQTVFNFKDWSQEVYNQDDFDLQAKELLSTDADKVLKKIKDYLSELVIIKNDDQYMLCGPSDIPYFILQKKSPCFFEIVEPEQKKLCNDIILIDQIGKINVPIPLPLLPSIIKETDARTDIKMNSRDYMEATIHNSNFIMDYYINNGCFFDDWGSSIRAIISKVSVDIMSSPDEDVEDAIQLKSALRNFMLNKNEQNFQYVMDRGINFFAKRSLYEQEHEDPQKRTAKEWAIINKNQTYKIAMENIYKLYQKIVQSAEKKMDNIVITEKHEHSALITDIKKIKEPQNISDVTGMRI